MNSIHTNTLKHSALVLFFCAFSLSISLPLCASLQKSYSELWLLDFGRMLKALSALENISVLSLYFEVSLHFFSLVFTFTNLFLLCFYFLFPTFRLSVQFICMCHDHEMFTHKYTTLHTHNEHLFKRISFR